jgi:hypothetical protein
MRIARHKIFKTVLGTVILCACATDLSGRLQPAQVSPDAAGATVMRLRDPVQPDVGGGVGVRELLGGSRWRLVGNIAQGEVFRAQDDVLTLDAGDSFEAHLVVERGKLVGFLLPSQRGFLACRTARPIVLEPESPR